MVVASVAAHIEENFDGPPKEVELDAGPVNFEDVEGNC
jgi:hypothetical protein